MLTGLSEEQNMIAGCIAAMALQVQAKARSIAAGQCRLCVFAIMNADNRHT